MPKSRIAVSFLFFVCGFVYTNWSTRLPDIQTAFELTNSALGLMLLFVAIGSLTSMPLTGWLIAHRGSRFATIISALLFCSSLFLFPILSLPWHLGMFFYIVGVFMGALDVSMNAQAVSVEQRFQRPMMSSFHAIFSVGMMLGALSGSLFVRHSIQHHFLIISSVCLPVAVACIPFLIADSIKPGAEGMKFVMPNRAMYIMGIIAFCAMLGEGAMADWSTNYLKNVIRTDSTLAPIGLSAFSAAMTLGRLGGDKLRILWGDKQLIFLNALLATIGLVFALLFHNAWTVIVGLFMVGAGLSTIIPIIYSRAGSSPSLPHGVGLAMVTTLGYFGFLFGSPLIGFLADAQGLRFALFFVVILFGLMSFLSQKIAD